MAKKVLSVRIDENIIDDLNYYCGVSEMSQADFLAEAITKLCEEKRMLRAGGASVMLPNPQIYLYSDEQAQKVAQELAACAAVLNTVCPSLDFAINRIVDFCNQRLFKDSKEQKNKFSANLYNDLENTKKGE